MDLSLLRRTVLSHMASVSIARPGRGGLTMPLTGPVAGVYTNTGHSTIATVTPGLVIASVTVGAGAYACAFAGYLTAFSGTPTPGVNDYDNMAIQSDPNAPGTFITAQILLVQQALNLTPSLAHLPIYALTTIQIIAIVGGTLNVGYRASIAASYPGPVGSLV